MPSTNLGTHDAEYNCTEDPNADTDSYCSPANFVPVQTFPMGPTSAACLGCHDDPSTYAHTSIMTAQSGVESCTTCHGPNADWDVAKVHGN